MSVACVNGVTEGIEGVLASTSAMPTSTGKHGTKGPYDSIMDASWPMNAPLRHGIRDA